MLALLLFVIALFACCQGQHHQNSKSKDLNYDKDAEYALLTYGLPDFEKVNARIVVAKKWRINFKRVAGCVVTKELLDSINTHNDSVNTLIAKRYGKDWNVDFNKEVDSEYVKESEVSKIINDIEIIKKRDSLMAKEGNGLYYRMEPVKNTNTYHVSVEGWGSVDSTFEMVSYFRLEVDYKTQTYKLLGDKVVKVP